MSTLLNPAEECLAISGTTMADHFPYFPDTCQQTQCPTHNSLEAYWERLPRTQRACFFLTVGLTEQEVLERRCHPTPHLTKDGEVGE